MPYPRRTLTRPGRLQPRVSWSPNRIPLHTGKSLVAFRCTEELYRDTRGVEGAVRTIAQLEPQSAVGRHIERQRHNVRPALRPRGQGPIRNIDRHIPWQDNRTRSAEAQSGVLPKAHTG